MGMYCTTQANEMEQSPWENRGSWAFPFPVSFPLILACWGTGQGTNFISTKSSLEYYSLRFITEILKMIL